MSRSAARRVFALALFALMAAACTDVGDDFALPDDCGTADMTVDGPRGDASTDAEGGLGDGAPVSDGGDEAFDDASEGDATMDGAEDDASEGGTSVDSGGMDAGAMDGPDAEAGVPDATLDTRSDATDGGVDGTLGEAGGDSGADSGAEAGGIVPCTSTGQTSCVPCFGNASGVCTPTEALIVQQDIAHGLATLDGGDDPNASCYGCLYTGACLDDTVFGDTNHECGDLSGVFDAGGGGGTLETTLCMDTVACILQTDCASVLGEVTNCYCGADHAGSACATAGGAVDGPCLTQEVNGIGFPASDNTDVLKSYTDFTKPGGMANQIFECAQSNGCTSCQP